MSVLRASALLLLLAVIGIPAGAQSRGLGAGEGTRWVYSTDVGALTIRGTAFDASSGVVHPHALVTLYDSIGGEVSLQVADEAGRFRLTARSAGDYIVGFRARTGIQGEQRIPVTLPPDRGVAMFIGFRPRQSCDGLLIYLPGTDRPPGPEIQVEIRDVLTGRPPAVPVLLRARQGALVDSAMISPGNGDAAISRLYLSELISADPVDVEVLSPDHETWSASNVWLEHACPYPKSPLLHVWLLPSE